MNKKAVYLIVGGDLRQIYLASILGENGKAYTLAVDENANCKNTIKLKALKELTENVDYLVLPIPITNDNVNVSTPYSKEQITLYSLVPYLKPNAVVFGGKFGKEAAIFTYKGFEVIDYLEREELSVMNAVPIVLYKLPI